MLSDCDKSSSLQQTLSGLVQILILSEGHKAEGGPDCGRGGACTHFLLRWKNVL